MKLSPVLWAAWWASLGGPKGVLSQGGCSFSRLTGMRLSFGDQMLYDFPVGAQDCETICDQNPSCFIFDAGGGKCRLWRNSKRSGYTGGLTGDVGWSMGYKHSCPNQEKCTMTTLGSGKVFPYPSTVPPFVNTASTEEICADFCAANPKCLASFWEQSTKTCGNQGSGKTFAASATYRSTIKTSCPDSLKPSIKADGAGCQWKRFSGNRTIPHGNQDASHWTWNFASSPVVSSLGDCERLCEEHEGCMAVNYRVSGQRCDLIAGMAQLVADAAFESSVKQGCGLQCSYKTWTGPTWSPGQLNRVVNSNAAESAEECRALCDSDEGCPLAIWKADLGTCWAGAPMAAVNNWAAGSTNWTTFLRQDCRGLPAVDQRRSKCAFARRTGGFYLPMLNNVGQFADYTSDYHFTEMKDQSSEEVCRRFCRSQTTCGGYWFGRAYGYPGLTCQAAVGFRDHNSWKTSNGGAVNHYAERNAAFLAFCAEDEARGKCNYTVLVGKKPANGYERYLVPEFPVSGRRACREACDAHPTCVFYQLQTLVEDSNVERFACWVASGFKAEYASAPITWNNDATFETGVRGKCGPSDPARRCFFEREEADGTFAVKTELAPAQPVADEEACQDLCEETGRECVAYEFTQQRSSADKTCAQLASIELTNGTFVPDDPAGPVRHVAYRSFCSDSSEKDNFTRTENATLPNAPSYLIFGAQVGIEEDCQSLCSVFDRKCYGYAYQTHKNSIGDGFPTCSIFAESPGDDFAYPSDGGVYIVGLKGGARNTRRSLAKPVHWSVSPEPVNLPAFVSSHLVQTQPQMEPRVGKAEADEELLKGELEPMSARHLLACAARCATAADCFALSFHQGLCRRWQDSEELDEVGTASEMGLLWKIKP